MLEASSKESPLAAGKKQQRGLVPLVYLRASGGQDDSEGCKINRERQSLKTSDVVPTRGQHHFKASLLFKKCDYELLALQGIKPKCGSA